MKKKKIVIIVSCVAVLLVYVCTYAYFRANESIVHVAEAIDGKTKHRVQGNEEHVALAVIGIMAASQDKEDVTEEANQLATEIIRKNKRLNIIFWPVRVLESTFWTIID